MFFQPCNGPTDRLQINASCTALLADCSPALSIHTVDPTNAQEDTEACNVSEDDCNMQLKMAGAAMHSAKVLTADRCEGVVVVARILLLLVVIVAVAVITVVD